MGNLIGRAFFLGAFLTVVIIGGFSTPHIGDYLLGLGGGAGLVMMAGTLALDVAQLRRKTGGRQS